VLVRNVPSLYSYDRSECYLRLEIEHVRVNLNHVNFLIIPLHTVTSFSGTITIVEAIYKGFIITTLTCKFIQTLLIVDPQSNIPGLVIRPPVISGVGEIGLESSRHVAESFLHYWYTLLVSNINYQRSGLLKSST